MRVLLPTLILFGTCWTYAETQPSAKVPPAGVDLSSDNLAAFGDVEDDHVLSNPWWRNFDLSGFGSVGYYDTGRNGTRPHGGFEIKEASLFVLAPRAAWRTS